jgi:hypothetical protein
VIKKKKTQLKEEKLEDRFFLKKKKKKNYLALVLNSTHRVNFETFRSHSLPNPGLNLTRM